MSSEVNLNDADVGWMVPENLELASYRYRAMIPMRELERRGLRTKVGIARLTVFQKDWDPLYPSLAKKLKAHGGTVVFDMSDDHFADRREAFYREMISLADLVTVSTEALAARVRAETGVDPVVITDPYEYPMVTPGMPSGAPKNLLWFGHSSNLDGLNEVLPRLTDYNVLAVTKGDAPDGVRSMQWGRQSMMQAFAWCDVVIIPVGQAVKNLAKSPNRMVESIRQGRYVVANPLGSYAPYGMWQGDIPEGLAWAAANPEKAVDAVRAAQPLVDTLHAPTVVGQKWYDTLTTLLVEREAA